MKAYYMLVDPIHKTSRIGDKEGDNLSLPILLRELGIKEEEYMYKELLGETIIPNMPKHTMYQGNIEGTSQVLSVIIID